VASLDTRWRREAGMLADASGVLLSVDRRCSLWVWGVGSDADHAHHLLYLQ